MGAAFVLLALLGLVIFEDPTTPPILDDKGEPIESSIARFEWINLNGSRQWLQLRGRDTSLPLLIVIHGGPGAPEAEAFRAFNAELENHFLTVNWHQRGAGRSYAEGAGLEGATIHTLYEDLEVLVDLLTTRFGQDKVFIIGHSWGSYLGLRFTYEHGDKVAAYVGTGQIVDIEESERRGCAFIAERARALGDAAALEEIESACVFPYTQERIFTQRQYVSEYGGAFAGDLSFVDFLWRIYRTDEATLWTFWELATGALNSMDVLWAEVESLNVRQWRSFDAPVYFALGRHDQQVSATLGAEYFQTLDAPCKHLKWFENSAHSPQFEEAEAFNRFMVETVKPGSFCTP